MPEWLCSCWIRCWSAILVNFASIRLRNKLWILDTWWPTSLCWYCSRRDHSYGCSWKHCKQSVIDSWYTNNWPCMELWKVQHGRKELINKSICLTLDCVFLHPALRMWYKAATKLWRCISSGKNDNVMQLQYLTFSF